MNFIPLKILKINFGIVISAVCQRIFTGGSHTKFKNLKKFRIPKMEIKLRSTYFCSTELFLKTIALILYSSKMFNLFISAITK